MPDSKLIERSGERITTTTGTPAASAKVYVYEAGTSSLMTIYSDSALTASMSNPATCDANGLCPFIYVGTDSYKLRVETSAGVLIDEEDNIPGATNTGNLSASYSRPRTPILIKTTAYTVVSGDMGSIINGNCSGGSFTVTLLSSATVTDGDWIIIRHIGTANAVQIVTTSSETITGPMTGSTVTAFSLTGYGESVTLCSDEAGWHIAAYSPPLLRGGTGVIQIADRITTTPGAPVAGERYIVQTGYGSFEQHDIVEYTGQTGVYIEITPPTDCGWLAYVQDEDSLYQFQGSAWVELGADQTAMEAATATGRYSSPGRQHYHPAHPKAWGYFTNSGTPTDEVNWKISSYTDGGTGIVGVGLTTQMSTGEYAVLYTLASDLSGGRNTSTTATGFGTGGFSLYSFVATANGNTTLASADYHGSFAVLGDV